MNITELVKRLEAVEELIASLEQRLPPYTSVPSKDLTERARVVKKYLAESGVPPNIRGQQ